MKYSGRHFTLRELEAVREWITREPTLTRTDLSRRFCSTFHWHKLDGGLKDMSCRVAFLRMQDDGLLELPAPTTKAPSGKLVIVPSARTDPQADIHEPAHELGKLTLHRVVGRPQASLWNEYIERYHYLGHKPLPGAQLRYFIKTENDRLVALIGFGASAWKIAPRDKFIGWSIPQREERLRFIINNARFLILPWIRSKNLASKILGLCAREIPAHWQMQYGYKPVLLETFVDSKRFIGTCYKAANWICVGETTGRGKCDTNYTATIVKKHIWLFPLEKSFRDTLCEP